MVQSCRQDQVAGAGGPLGRLRLARVHGEAAGYLVPSQRRRQASESRNICWVVALSALVEK